MLGAPIGDRYQVIRELGRGGMGVVYLGHDLRRDMPVALKVLSRAQAASPLALKREFRVVAPLRHRNLIELYELVADADRGCYFTMEYVDGIDPRRWVLADAARPGSRALGTPARADHPRLSISHDPTALAPSADTPTERSPETPIVAGATALPVDFARLRHVVVELAAGLQFLHDHGVVHRDVKPSNVLVTGASRLVLLDFGLAVSWKRSLLGGTAGMLVGTTAYLAPEYIERSHVAPAMDLYALGAMTFELITGGVPFAGSVHDVVRAHRRTVPPRTRDVVADVPPDIDQLVADLLAKDPGARPSAASVLERVGGTTVARSGRRSARFVGRDAELRELDAVIGDATARARLVVVSGPSGIGKTALVAAAVARAASSPSVITWRGRCDDRERVPYRAFDPIVDDLAAELAGDPGLAFGIPFAGALGRVFPAVAPAFAPDAAPPAGDLRVERDRALIALAALLDRITRDHAAVIAIDDLQWADDESLELLAVVVERVARPLTIIATWTDAEIVSPALAKLLERLGPRGARLAIGPMTDADLAALVTAIAPANDALPVDAVVASAGGSPYLAELITEGGTEDRRIDCSAIDGRSRFWRLPSVEREVAEAAAVAGVVVSFDALRAIAGLDSRALFSALRGLADDRVIRVEPAAHQEPVYTYYHQRLRDAVYDGLAPARRCDLHRRLATWLEASARDEREALAVHWDRAGQPERAATWAVAAADAAMTKLAFDHAAIWYQRALGLGVDHGERSRIRERTADALMLAGRLADAARWYLALAGGAAGDHRLRWQLRAAEAKIKLGELPAGLALIDGILAARGLPRPRRREISVARAGGVALKLIGTPDALTSSAPVDDVLASTYRVIGSFLSTPYPVEAFEYVLRGIALAERTGDRAGHAIGLAMVAGYLAAGTLGRFGDRAIAGAARLSEASGDPYARMVSSAAAVILDTVRGRWDAMRRSHADGEQICRRLGLDRTWEASFLCSYRALGELAAGDPALAIDLLGTRADTADDLFTRAIVGSLRGRALAAAGDIVGARHVRDRLRRDRASFHGMGAIHRLAFEGELALAEHDWDAAAAIASEMATAARAAWLTTLPVVAAMTDVIAATADLGKANGGGDDAATAARRVRARARMLFVRGRPSFYAPIALRLWAQSERLLGNRRVADVLLGRAARAAADRGGRVDRLAIAALSGAAIDAGALAPVLRWSTGGAL